MAGFAVLSKGSINRGAGASRAPAEATLDERFRRGDEAAPAEIWVRFSAGACLRIEQKYKGLLPRDMAEQVVIEAFWEAWRHRDRYDPHKSPLESWLRLLAEHKAADCCERRYMQARQFELALASGELDALGPRVAAQADKQDAGDGADQGHRLREKVRAALAALPAGEREVLWADGCSPEGHVSGTVLSAELGVTPEAIRQRRRRGKARLKKELQRLGVDTERRGNGSIVFIIREDATPLVYAGWHYIPPV